MNALIQLKKATPLFLVFALVCLTLSPRVQAVVPAPDGGYPGGNTAEGQTALLNLSTGGFNTAVGYLSLRSNTTNSFNTAVGAGALIANTADENTATGAGALLSTTTGPFNTANGAFALSSNSTGTQNTATGASALQSNTTGGFNTAVGAAALPHNTSGSNNTAVGTGAGFFASQGSNNVYIGAGMLGVVGESNACYIASIFGQISSGGTAVFVNLDGKLGTTTSSKRFKEDIRPMDKASEVVYALKPVAFRYKKEIDPTGTSQLGLVAEDVEKVNPALVVRDKEGKPYSVRYDQINAMLLNEFLKEHRKVQEQEATITQLNRDFRATVAQLTTRLDEQAAQIQKVSAQLAAASPSRGGLEASKFATGRIRRGGPAPQVVNNP
jgi:Chaperone of endosialidase